MPPNGSFWTRFRTGWRRLWALLPITWQGGLAGFLGGLLFYVLGVKESDWILLALGAIVVTIVVLDVFFVGLVALVAAFSIRRKNRDLRLDLRTDTRTPIQSGFLLPRIFVPFVDFSVTWNDPQASVEITTDTEGKTELVRFSRRDAGSTIHRLFEVRDFFGLASVRWERLDPQPFRVLPQIFASSPALARSFVDGDDRFVPSRPRLGDLVDTRAYMPGDPIRHIHWKNFARTQQVIVRIPEPAASLERQIMAYLICDGGDEFAAELARWSIEIGSLGDGWRFGADGSPGYASDIASAREILAGSGRAFRRCGRDLETWLQTIAFRADQHHLLLFASARLRLWLPAIQGILERHTSSCSLILGSNLPNPADPDSTDLPQTPSPARLRLQRLFFLPEPLPPPALADDWKRLQQFARDGLDLRILHRPRSSATEEEDSPLSGYSYASHDPS